jgi:5-methylcytosine-specific restriction endonuclease McrA
MNWLRQDKRLAIYIRDGFQCLYCQSGHWLSLDHLKPTSKGGGNESENLVTSCMSCNGKRSYRPWRTFAKGAASRIEKMRLRPLPISMARELLAKHGGLASVLANQTKKETK